VVITGAQASKVLFASNKSAGGLLSATAVEFVKDGSAFLTKPVKREIVLSAGTFVHLKVQTFIQLYLGSFQTPQLLELSGLFLHWK
jgi:hypothetical protein